MLNKIINTFNVEKLKLNTTNLQFLNQFILKLFCQHSQLSKGSLILTLQHFSAKFKVYRDKVAP